MSNHRSEHRRSGPILAPRPLTPRRANTSQVFEVDSALSPTPVARPHRSSPLAGPALSQESLTAKERPPTTKPIRIASAPNLATLREVAAAEDGVPPVPILNSNHPHSASSSRSSSPVFSARHARFSSQESPASLSSTRRNSGHNWMAESTYSDTPKFSRLSMGGAVVMPVSAKEHRRKSRLPQANFTPETAGHSPLSSISTLSLEGTESSMRTSPTLSSSATSISEMELESDFGQLSEVTKCPSPPLSPPPVARLADKGNRVERRMTKLFPSLGRSTLGHQQQQHHPPLSTMFTQSEVRLAPSTTKPEPHRSLWRKLLPRMSKA